MLIKEPNSTKGKEFCFRFIVELLGIYDGYVKNSENETSTEKEQAVVDAIHNGGAMIAGVGEALGARGRAVGGVLATGADFAANIYTIIKAEIDEKEIKERSNFFATMRLQLKVNNFQELSDLLTKVAYALYNRYKLTIEKLDNAPGTGSIIIFARFFAYAIKEKISTKQIYLTSMMDDPVEILLKAVVLSEDNALYKKKVLNLKTANIYLTKDSKYKDNNNWTIEGVILRSPGKIYGEITALTNSRSRQDNGATEKYEPILFYSQKQALSYGYEIPEKIKNNLAKIRTLTDPRDETSIFKLITGQCDTEEVREDDLRLLVLNSDEKNNIEHIASYVTSNNNPININGRGRRGNGVCPYIKGLFDRPPLMLAIINGQKETVKELLLRGANFNSKDYNEWTCLDHAVVKKHVEITRILAEYNAEQNKTSVEALNLLLNPLPEANENKIEFTV